MVADFLISHQEDCDKYSDVYGELEAAMKAVAATVYIGEHCMPSFLHANCHDSIAGAESVRRDCSSKLKPTQLNSI
jgi:hypothetical protein